MNHDRTIAEMQRDYEMRQECKTKNMKLKSEDEYYFGIRANSVVKLKKQQQPEDISVNVSREITFLEEIELIRASANPNTLLHHDDETIEIDDKLNNKFK